MLSLSLAIFALYVAASWLGTRVPKSVDWQRYVVAAALLLHTFALIRQTLPGGVLQVSIGAAASLFAWQSALILWIVCWTSPLRTLGVAMYPLAALCVLWPALTENDAPPVSDWPVGMHILFSLLSAGLLTLAAIHALGLTILDRILHRPENLALARRLPPLQTMERLLFQLIHIGFFLLSLTLLSGIFLNHEQRSQPQTMIVLSFGAWVIYGILIFGRIRYGWRARTAIRWVLSGYVMLVAAYFGVKLLMDPVLSTHLN